MMLLLSHMNETSDEKETADRYRKRLSATLETSDASMAREQLGYKRKTH